MTISVSRMESFSDGVIAIIMTLMVLEIPLPQSTGRIELLEFLKSIMIYFASFVIVGAQWNRQHRMLDEIKEVSNSFAWKNLIHIFLLSLVPLFMKWVMLDPTSVIPALGYTIVFLLNDFGTKVLFFSLLKENKELNVIKRVESQNKGLSFLRFIGLLLGLAAVLGLSVVLPEISIVLFIVFPVIASLSNIFETNTGRRPGHRAPGRRERYDKSETQSI